MRAIRVFTTTSPSGRYANVQCLPGGRQADAISTSGSVQAHIAFRILHQGRKLSESKEFSLCDV